jgi:xanthine dehydrogenase/oxidase
MATPAGNIVTGSPISDLNPIFLATESVFTLASLEYKCDSATVVRRLVNATEFWTGYRQTLLHPFEVLECVYIPCSTHGEFIRAYKQARRRDDDIAIVMLA